MGVACRHEVSMVNNYISKTSIALCKPCINQSVIIYPLIISSINLIVRARAYCAFRFDIAGRDAGGELVFCNTL